MSTNVDKNFVLPSFDGREIEWHDAIEPVFDLYGIFREDGRYVRMPEKVAAAVNDGTHALFTNTAGGRLRFATDSSFMAVTADQPGYAVMPHMAAQGSCGFDIVCDGALARPFVSGIDLYSANPVSGKHTEAIWDLKYTISDMAPGMHEYTIVFPLYANVSTLKIGLAPGCRLTGGVKYSHTLPTVYYGSSITQGGCASRPATCYQDRLSRLWDRDYINLGFSGNARGELTMADYIRELPMNLFVYDYDHNAPTPEHLEKTHEAFFLRFREKQPDTPVLMMTRPTPAGQPMEHNERRRATILKTYNNALARGDRNVAFLDVWPLFVGQDATVDTIHPTDLGFKIMADGIARVVAEKGWNK